LPVLLVLGLLVRVVFLEADPVYRAWAGYLTDEGRWTEVAREWALFRELELGNQLRLMHVIIAPVFQALIAVSFEVFDVSFASARVVSALFGIALLVAAVAFVRGRLDRTGVLFVAFGFALQPDLVFFSRIAIPEMAAMFCEVVAFALILSADRSIRRALAAGLVTALAMGMKATVFPVFFVFAVVLFVHDRAEPRKLRLLRLSAFVMGVVGPAVMVLTAGLVAISGGGGGERIGGTFGLLADFIAPNDLFGALTQLFYVPYGPAANVLLVPAWAIGGLLLVQGKKPAGPDGSLYVGTAIWTGCWIAVASLLAYFPDRYAIHVVMPLILNIGAGLSVLRRTWAVGEGPLPLGGTRAWRVFVAAWWALPAATLLAPVLLGLAATVPGFVPDGLSHRLATIVLGVLALVLGLTGPWASDRRAWLTVLITPLACAPILAGAFEVDLSEGLWALGAAETLGKALVLICAFAAAVAVSRLVSVGSRVRVSAYAYLLPLVLLWTGMMARTLVTRTYTIRDTSSLVKELAGEREFVETLTAGSLFLGNDLRYREVSPDLFRSSSPAEFVVVVLGLATIPVDGYETLAVVQPRMGRLMTPLDSRIWILQLRPQPTP